MRFKLSKSVIGHHLLAFDFDDGIKQHWQLMQKSWTHFKFPKFVSPTLWIGLLSLITVLPLFAVESLKPRTRVVILSDISNEPDDQMSLVRFLTYANEFEVEGLIATTSCWRRTHPDRKTVLDVIDAYEEVYPNLILHAEGYPKADYLRTITLSGVDGYGMNAAANQLDNEAINHIIEVLDQKDPRPVWFCAWGGANTLGGAVMKLQKERPSDVKRLVSKIRGYEIALQDDGFAYIAHHFPKTKLLSARLLWKGISKTTPTFNAWSESWGGNNTVFSSSWISEHVQNNHGPLGAQYPDAVYLWEGDTPSFLHIIPNGLRDPEQIGQGGWGGRFHSTKQLNVRTGSGNDTVDALLDQYRDYELYSDANDSWSFEGHSYENEYCSVFRWREDFQNDFAARMDWCVADNFNKANHHPVAALNGDRSKDIIEIPANPGETVKLSAIGSKDPDGNTIDYQWMIYHEAGNFPLQLKLERSRGVETTLNIPESKQDSFIGKTIHVILKITDNGIPNLVAYRRAIIRVGH